MTLSVNTSYRSGFQNHSESNLYENDDWGQRSSQIPTKAAAKRNTMEQTDAACLCDEEPFSPIVDPAERLAGLPQ